jgi:hypothetical protein
MPKFRIVIFKAVETGGDSRVTPIEELQSGEVEAESLWAARDRARREWEQKNPFNMDRIFVFGSSIGWPATN